MEKRKADAPESEKCSFGDNLNDGCHKKMKTGLQCQIKISQYINGELVLLILMYQLRPHVITMSISLVNTSRHSLINVVISTTNIQRRKLKVDMLLVLRWQ